MAKPNAKTLQERMGFTDGDLKTPGHDAIMLWLDEQTTSSQLIAWIERDGWVDGDIGTEWMRYRVADFMKPYASDLQIAKRTEASAQERITKCQEALDGTKPYQMHAGGEAPAEKVRLWLKEAQAELSAATQRVITTERSIESAQTKVRSIERPPWPGFQLTKKQWEMPVMSGSYTVGFVDFVAHYRYPVLEACCGTDTDPCWEVAWQDRQVCFEVKTTIPSLGELLRQLSQYREYLHRVNTPHRPIFVVCPDARFADKIREQGFGFIQSPGASPKGNGQAKDEGWLFGAPVR